MEAIQEPDTAGGAQVLRLGLQRALSSAAGLELRAALSSNTPGASAALQEASAAAHARAPGALHRLRLDLETNAVDASRATLEGSLQLGRSALASASLGADVPLHELLRPWQAGRLRRQQQQQQQRAGASAGAALAVRLGRRAKLQARWLAAAAASRQLLLECAACVGRSHVLRLSLQCSAAEAWMQPGQGGGEAAARASGGSAWLECSLSAAWRPAAALLLAPNEQLDARGDSQQQKQKQQQRRHKQQQQPQQQQPQQQQPQQQQQQQQQQQGAKSQHAAGGEWRWQGAGACKRHSGGAGGGSSGGAGGATTADGSVRGGERGSAPWPGGAVPGLPGPEGQRWTLSCAMDPRQPSSWSVSLLLHGGCQPQWQQALCVAGCGEHAALPWPAKSPWAGGAAG